MKIILANPRGFCAGVDRAIHIVEKALEKFGTPIFVRHEIVHNQFVVDSLRRQGAVFVEEVDEVPPGATVVFSAHGVAEKVYEEALYRGNRILDASCPLVKKVHLSAQRHARQGAQVILIGHAGHAEVEGTLGQLPKGSIFLVGSVADVDKLPLEPETNLAYITQTTLSVEETRHIIAALKNRFPQIKGPERGDLCYATTNRQAAVREICKNAQLLLVVGASNSSNSNRLCELGKEYGTPSYLIASVADVRTHWFAGVSTVAISSGASAPEVLVQELVAWIQHNYQVESVEHSITMEENVKFNLPVELQD